MFEIREDCRTIKDNCCNKGIILLKNNTTKVEMTNNTHKIK
jgi:hypothetical protein